MSGVPRVLAPAIGLWALCAASAWPSPAEPGPGDIRFIVAEAQKVQEADVAAWVRYQFGRRMEREDFDDSGKVVEKDDLEFLITPDGEGFHEELLRHNGASAGESERDKLRRAAGFTKHYRTLVAGTEVQEEGGYSLGQLLHLSSYRFMGKEPLNGVDCYRLDFTPDDVQPRMGGLAAKFTKAMAGSLWITTEGFHLAAAKAETVRPISIGLLLAKVYSLKVRMNAGPVGDGVWLPLRVEVDTEARILIKGLHRENLFTYSDFQRILSPD